MKRWCVFSLAAGVLLGAVWFSVGNREETQKEGRPVPALRMAGEAVRAEAEDMGVAEGHERGTLRGWPRVVRFGGAVRTEAAEELKEAGAVVAGYLPDCAFLAEIPESAMGAVRAVQGVVGVEEYVPAWKVSRGLLELAKRGKGEGVDVRVQTFAPEDEGRVAARMAGLGAVEIVETGRQGAGRVRSRWGLVTGRMTAGAVLELAAEPEVQWVEEAVEERLCNDVARSAGGLAVEGVEALGLDGKGEIVAVMDTGLDSGDAEGLHPDFEGQVAAALAYAREGNWSDPAGHGTHVAGSIAGTGAASAGQYRGMAPGARLVVQSVADAAGGLHIPDEVAEALDAAYLLGARIHNDSWGGDVQGAYNLRAQQVDEYVWDHPDLLVVASAGNEGIDGDGDGRVDSGSLGSPASAKNALAVGAAESGREPGGGGRTSETYFKRWPLRFLADPIAADLISTPPEGAPPGLAGFSSRGPAADGRTKPDVVAPGTDIVSVRSRAASSTGWGVHPSNTNYIFNGGTSMAAPLASGSAALVRQWAKRRFGLESPSAAALKAALCGGARSLSPGQYGEGEWREIPPRPSSAEGHGHIDVEATLRPGGGAVAVLHEGTEEAALATGGEARWGFEIAEAGLPLTVALAYSDAPGLPGAEVALVNDLDLRLAAPDGTVYGVGGVPEGGADRLNNVERIDLASAATGRWEVVVAGWNVPVGPQPWAVYLRGAIRTAPVIAHEPLQNQSAAAEGYGVEAEIRAEGAWNADTAVMHWRVDGGTERTAAMVAVGEAEELFPATVFRAEIPAEELGSRIEYWLTAGGSRAPAADGCWAFTVAPDVSLTVAGEPGEAGAPEPPYGTWMVPSGTVVRVSAPAVIPDADEPEARRVVCLGWRGRGSVPAEGDEAEAEIAVEEDSVLVWCWQEQVVLRETCNPAGLAEERRAWWAVGADAESSAPAAEWLRDGAGERYAFAGWTLDGERWPDAVSPCPREARGIAMDGPRTLCARYLPEKQDSDGDGLPDWFVARYFPAGGAVPGGDPDGDGWENEMEAADHSDPLDAASQPAPPVIAHEPVASPHTGAFPVRIGATVTDAGGVASAMLYIRRNGKAERGIAMAPEDGADGVWSAQTPGTAADGDVFAYSIAATDVAGLVARTEEYAFEVLWPGLEASPLAGVRAELGAEEVAEAVFTFANTGSIPLEISLSFAPVGFADDAESGTNGWTAAAGEGAAESLWHIGGVEFHSASNAWSDAAPDYLPTYVCGADDSLASPSVRLWPADAPGGEVPRLAFWHKADFERDWEGEAEAGDGVVRMWDSGIVEGRAEGGVWRLVTPDGGYPAVQDETASVFPAGMPCFAPTDGWEPVTADLSAFASNAAAASSPAQIRFHFASDAYVVHEGWRIDDVEITPRTHRAGWATLSADTLALAPGERTNVVLRLDNAGFGPMETDWLLLDIRHNDPRLPDPLPVPIALANISRRLTVTAEGPGSAEPAGETAYPGPATVRLEFTPNEGAMLADVQLDGELLDGSLCGATERVETELPLLGNHTVHAVFAVSPPADAVPSADWLARYGLTNRPAAAEAVLDPDRDGLLTWQEAEVGSNPTDSADAPLRVRLLPPVGEENGWRLVWMAYTNPGATYIVLGGSNLLDAGGLVPVFGEPLVAAPPVMTSPPLPAAEGKAGFHAVVFRP